MRSPTWTRACWMWRGCLSSFKYSVICEFERRRPNQVFHQNRKGMSTISQAATKKSNLLRVDMRWRRGTAEASTTTGEFNVSDVNGRPTMSVPAFHSAFEAGRLFDEAPLSFP